MSAQLSSSEARRTTPVSQEEAKFDCDICSKEFSKRAYLNIHRKNVHKAPGVYSKLGQNKKEARMERAIYKCGICQKEYCLRNTLARHIREKHGNEPIDSTQFPKKCLLCGEKFMTRGAVFKHMNTHHMEELEVAGILARMSDYERCSVPKETEDNKENTPVQIPLPVPIVVSASSTSPTPIIVPAPAPPVIQKVVGSQEFMIIKKKPLFCVENILKI